MTITFQPTMLEDPKFKALITNKEMLSIYRPCPEARTANITFFYDKRNGKILTRVIYSFESYQVCQATKKNLKSSHKPSDVFRTIMLDPERNLLTVYYSRI